MRKHAVGANSIAKVVAALAVALVLCLPSYAQAVPPAKVDSGQPVRAELLQFRFTTHLWQGGNQPFYEGSSSFPSGRIVFPGHLMRSGKLTLETAGRKFALQRVGALGLAMFGVYPTEYVVATHDWTGLVSPETGEAKLHMRFATDSSGMYKGFLVSPEPGNTGSHVWRNAAAATDELRFAAISDPRSD